MTTPHFGNQTVSKLSSRALLFLLSGMSFIGCGGPPAPQVKEIVTHSQGSTSTQVYSYTSDDELKRVVYSTSGGNTEDRLELAYRDGKVSKVEFHDNIPNYPTSRSSDITSMKFGYSEDRVTGVDLSFSEFPGLEMKGEMDYNSDDMLSELEIDISVVDSDFRSRAAFSFDYTSDSLFDKFIFKSDQGRETTDFEYNSEDLLSEITRGWDSGTHVEHEFSYNDEDQLVEYESGDEECKLSYNEDDLVKEIKCTDSRGDRTTHQISYYQDESVEGMIPRIPGIGFGNFFSLDGKSLSPQDFAEPMSIYTLLEW